MRGFERPGPRTEMDNARHDLRRWDEGPRRDLEHDLRLCEPLYEDRKASIRFAAWHGDKALGDLTLEHQGQTFIIADPVEPAEEERRGDVVGQIGDNLARRIRQLRRVDRQRVGGYHIEAPGIANGELFKSRKTTRVTFDRDNPTGVGGEQRTGQPAGTGADLDDRGILQRPGGPDDPARQVQVEEEMLPENLARL